MRYYPEDPRTAYVQAYVGSVQRQHKPRWSWRRMRRLCRCGADLPCEIRAAKLGTLEVVRRPMPGPPQ